MSISSAVEWRSILIAAVGIAALPALWNIVARNENRNRTIQRLVGDKYRGTCLLAVWIFLLSSLRDWAFMRAILANPPSRVAPLFPITSRGDGGGGKEMLLMARALKAASTTMVLFGTTLVMSAFVRLGVVGTYLGDYFGIRMKERVVSFPFSHFENPMYVGATLNFLGASLAHNSRVGVALTAWIAAVYYVTAVYFENPYTEKIYKDDADK